MELSQRAQHHALAQGVVVGPADGQGVQERRQCRGAEADPGLGQGLPGVGDHQLVAQVLQHPECLLEQALGGRVVAERAVDQARGPQGERHAPAAAEPTVRAVCFLERRQGLLVAALLQVDRGREAGGVPQPGIVAGGTEPFRGAGERGAGGAEPALFAVDAAGPGEHDGQAPQIVRLLHKGPGLIEVRQGLVVAVLGVAQLPEAGEQHRLPGSVPGTPGGRDGRVVRTPPLLEAVGHAEGGGAEREGHFTRGEGQVEGCGPLHGGHQGRRLGLVPRGGVLGDRCSGPGRRVVGAHLELAGGGCRGMPADQPEP